MTTHLLWFDCETTGLHTEDDFIVEVAAVLTEADGDYREIARGEWVVDPSYDYIRPGQSFPAAPGQWRDRMPERVVEMHATTGLIDLIPSGAPIAHVDMEIADMLDLAKAEENEVVLAGSGVSHFDHYFVKGHLPMTAGYLRYATLDVGVLRRAFEFAGRDDLQANGQTFTEAKVPHRAMADIEDHLAEWRVYAPLLRSIALP